MNEALKKAGVTERRTSQVIRGLTGEYLIASPVDKFADYDDTGLVARALGEAGAARWIARVTKCINSRRVETFRNRPDLSIPAREGRTPALAIMTTRRNLPGRQPEYNEWLVNNPTPPNLL